MQRAFNFLQFISYLVILLYYIAVFYPGYYSTDSIYTISMALGKEPITNWHPSLLIIIWKLIYSFTHHLEFIWIFQIILLFHSVFIASKIFTNQFIKLIFPLLLLLWPSLFSNFGAVWKDIWTVIFMLYVIGYSVLGFKNKSVACSLLSILAVLVVCMLRIDYFLVASVFLVFPFAVLYQAYLFKFKFTISYIFILFYSIFILIFLFSKSIIETNTVQIYKHPWSTFVVWDIVGTYMYSNEKQDIVFGDTHIPYEKYSKIYNNKTSDLIAFNGNVFALDLPQGITSVENYNKENEILFPLWLHTIITKPFSYIQHRKNITSQFLGLNNEIHYPYPFGTINNKLDLKFERTPQNIDIYWFLDSHANGFFWRLWIYILFSVLILSLSLFLIKDNFNKVLMLVFFSSLLGTLVRVLVLPATDFRYGIYIVVITLISFIYFIDILLSRFITKNTFVDTKLSI